MGEQAVIGSVREIPQDFDRAVTITKGKFEIGGADCRLGACHRVRKP